MWAGLCKQLWFSTWMDAFVYFSVFYTDPYAENGVERVYCGILHLLCEESLKFRNRIRDVGVCFCYLDLVSPFKVPPAIDLHFFPTLMSVKTNEQHFFTQHHFFCEWLNMWMKPLCCWGLYWLKSPLKVILYFKIKKNIKYIHTDLPQ